jgi:Porin subfamily
MATLSRKTWHSPLAYSALCLSLLVPGKVSADGAFAPAPPSTPDQAHCNALGEGFLAVSGSNACIKISGYVSAGSDFSAVVVKGTQDASPFAPKSGAGFESQSAVSAQRQFDTPLGPGRLYVEVRHNSLGQ